LAHRTRVLLSPLDPINWTLSRAAWTLIVIGIGFVVLESLRLGTWPSAVLMWLTLAAILTILGRVQRIRYRDIATLAVPAVLVLAVMPFAADATLQLITTFVIFFGAIAIPFFPRTLVAWIGFVAPAYYTSIAEADENVADTFVQAGDAIHAQLVASGGDVSKIAGTVATARESVMALPSLDDDWENVRGLFLNYLDWHNRTPDPTDEDWAERRALLNTVDDARNEVVKAHSQWVGHRLLSIEPAARG